MEEERRIINNTVSEIEAVDKVDNSAEACSDGPRAALGAVERNGTDPG